MPAIPPADRLASPASGGDGTPPGKRRASPETAMGSVQFLTARYDSGNLEPSPANTGPIDFRIGSVEAPCDIAIQATPPDVAAMQNGAHWLPLP